VEERWPSSDLDRHEVLQVVGATGERWTAPVALRVPLRSQQTVQALVASGVGRRRSFRVFTMDPDDESTGDRAAEGSAAAHSSPGTGTATGLLLRARRSETAQAVCVELEHDRP